MVGHRLKDLRKNRKLSQDQLAEALSLSRVSITSYEAGSRTPDIYTLVKIADYFDVSTDYLLGRVELSRSVNFLDMLDGQLVARLAVIAELAEQEKTIISEIIDFSLLKIKQCRG